MQEIAFALATAIDVLDAVRASGRVAADEFPKVVERMSFFLNSGIRFVEEICKVRAMTELWDRITLGALRHHRSEGAPVPLRRAGELVGAHRGAAREQRAAHRARDARRHDVEAGTGPRRAASRVERGARDCPDRGTSSGRCASSRCSRSRPICSSTTTSSTARSSSSARPRSSRAAATAELDRILAARRRVREHRAAQGRAGAVARRPDAAHRVGRHLDRRRQHVHRDGAVAAHGAARR